MARQSPAPAAASAPEPLLSAREAMAILGCCRAFLTRHATELGGVKIGSRLMFTAAGLRAYIEGQRVRQEPTTPVVEPAPMPIGAARTYGHGPINPITRRPWGE